MNVIFSLVLRPRVSAATTNSLGRKSIGRWISWRTPWSKLTSMNLGWATRTGPISGAGILNGDRKPRVKPLANVWFLAVISEPLLGLLSYVLALNHGTLSVYISNIALDGETFSGDSNCKPK